ncbi:hypothetical protein Peur_009059 [Populus x canadensis]
MNRSCNRENPHILIVMIAEKQIMKGGGDGKEREIMGPQKPAREMSDTAPEINLLPFFSLHLVLGSLREPAYSVNQYAGQHCVPRDCLLLGDRYSANDKKSSLGLFSPCFPRMLFWCSKYRRVGLQLHGLCILLPSVLLLE